MKKITFFIHNTDKKKFLAKLQSLGLIHLEMKNTITKDKYRNLQKKKHSYESILLNINRLYKIHDSIIEKDSNNRIEELTNENSSQFPADCKTFHQKMVHLEFRFDRLDKEYLAKEELIKHRKQLEPWGEFDWIKLEKLKEHRISYEFYITTESSFIDYQYNKENLITVSKSKGLIHILRLVSMDDPNNEELPFEKINLAKMSLSELDKDLEIINRSIFQDELFLSKFAFESEKIQQMIQNLEDLSEFEKAKFSLDYEKQGVVFTISGYFPNSQGSEIFDFLKSQKVSYTVSNPKTDENVPIQLKNNRFSRAFEPITKIFALPKYMELDPTSFFAPFFTLFFGLCLGDIGYGTILLFISGFAYFKVKKEYKIIPLLLIFLSASTIFSGVLLNTFFGETFFRVPESNFYILESGKDFAILSTYTKEGRTIYPAMALALVLGFVQLTLGILLKSINQFLLNRKIIYSLQPLSVLAILWGGMIVALHNDLLELGFNSQFTIGVFPIGAWIGSISVTNGMILFIIGVIGFFLFNSPSQSLVLRPIFGIWEAYQFIIGFSGDFLSYVRLFALGLASGLLGNAFNQIAFMVLPDKNLSSPFIILTIVILIIGHVLNILLSVLGSFVHPLRLTFVEFYKNMNFVGGGREFKAFSRS